MKILAIGDFHGKFPKKFENLIKKEKMDVVVSIGDYPPFHYRKLWFKHCYNTGKELWEVIGKKKYKELVLEDLRRGEDAVKKLNKVSVTVFTVLGNIDWPSPNDITDYRSSSLKTKKNNLPNWGTFDNFAKRLKKYKNIKRIDYSYIKFNNFVFIGMRGHSFPGHVKSKAYKKYRAKLDRLFKKFKGKKIIFVSHNVPYKTNLDKITDKKAHKHVRGRHFGSKLTRRIIDRYQPILAVGGHIHEGRGKQKLKKTLMVNPGAIHEGEAAIIDIDEKGGIKVKFI